MKFLRYIVKLLKLNSGLSGISLFQHWRIYSEWSRQISSKSTPLSLGLPWITIVSKNYLVKFLKDKVAEGDTLKVFEFGSGGSSIFFTKYVAEVISVEHDEKWYSLVTDRMLKDNVSNWSGNLVEPEALNPEAVSLLDASNPRHYYTTDLTYSNCNFKKYASFVDQYRDQYFDVVLVDGRSRPSCLLHSLGKVKKGGLLVLDNAERDYYFRMKIISENEFKLVSSSFGATISNRAITKTNIYLKLV